MFFMKTFISKLFMTITMAINDGNASAKLVTL